ncbi:MAG: hypothetical protein K6E35_08760 [Bacteroidales bacterium]|nr:hypothetical protein [Bacteroidales bacterium]
MGLFASLLDSITNASALGYEIAKDQSLTGAQREANQFSAEQVELDRRFQAAEAEKARSWQEDQFLKYNSPAAQVRQYQEAGVNPALMFGDPSTPAPSQTSVPSGASASSVTPSGGDVVGMIGQMLSLSKLDAEIANIRSSTRANEAEAFGRELNNALVEKFGEAEAENKVNLLAGQINELVSRQGLQDAQKAFAFAQKTLAENQAKGVTFENTEKEWKAGFIDKFHMTPELAGDLAKALATLGAGVLMTFLKKPQQLIESVTSGPKGVTITQNTFK